MKLLKFIVFTAGISFYVNAQEVPKFKDEKVTAYAQEYANFSKKVKLLKGDFSKGNLDKISADLSLKGQEIFKNLTPEDSKKLADYIEAVFNKINQDAAQLSKVKNEAPKELTTPIEKRTKLSLVEGIKIPSFKNDEINSYVQEYAYYIKDFIKYKGKFSEIMDNRAEELTKKANIIVETITAEDAEKLNKFTTTLTKKVQ